MRLDVNPLLDSESPSSGGESTWREEFAIVPAQAPAILFFGSCGAWPPNGASFTGCGKSRVAQALLPVRFCRLRIHHRFNHNCKTRTGKSACATKTCLELTFSAAREARAIGGQARQFPKK